MRNSGVSGGGLSGLFKGFGAGSMAVEKSKVLWRIFKEVFFESKEVETVSSFQIFGKIFLGG